MKALINALHMFRTNKKDIRNVPFDVAQPPWREGVNWTFIRRSGRLLNVLLGSSFHCNFELNLVINPFQANITPGEMIKGFLMFSGWLSKEHRPKMD